MAKSLPPGEIAAGLVPGVEEPLVLNALPDPFDERDLLYRPRLQPLLTRMDRRPGSRHVFLQRGNSCVGHAIATMIDTVLALRPGDDDAPATDGPIRVSPYMLYYLARRYDEFPGAADVGSSLRGGLKGWFHHGVTLAEDWPELETEREADLDEPDFIRRCADRPLGAFYRVSAYRLDDMQSAISELNCIVASGVIHDGWLAPPALEKNDERMHVIVRRDNPMLLGGHAFALVGYNHTGFLVQNSWGTGWGKGGFATLPYEDWLDCAYDAWVARPGVPQTPFASGRKIAVATGSQLATAPGLHRQKLLRHVVNLDNNGRLSGHGKFVSTPAQIVRLFGAMKKRHDRWLEGRLVDRRHVVLYAHGGLVSEGSGLEIAQKHLDFWLANRVYPINFAWQSGPVEVFADHLADSIRGRIPFGGIGFDLAEQFDRLVERVAGSNLRWMWDEMKENARAASEPEGGASLVVDHLAEYLASHGDAATSVHLVGHSAGSIFQAGLLGRLIDAGIPVESFILLAPAIRVDEFERDILPRLRADEVKRFASFALSDKRELADAIEAKGLKLYRKSLLYLVSRALESQTGSPRYEVPLLGQEKFLGEELLDRGRLTVREAIEESGGELVFAPSSDPAHSRCDSRTHGGFDDDPVTMTSVIMRILNVRDPGKVHYYHGSRAQAQVESPAAEAQAAEAEKSGPESSAALEGGPVLRTLEESGWKRVLRQ